MGELFQRWSMGSFRGSLQGARPHVRRLPPYGPPRPPPFVVRALGCVVFWLGLGFWSGGAVSPGPLRVGYCC